MGVKRYARHRWRRWYFLAIKWHSKWQAAYDFLFTFSSNHGSIWLHFRDTDNMSFFVLKDILAISDGHIATLISSMGFPISVR